MLTEQDFIDRLRAAIVAAGSQKAYAEHIGVSESYLSDVLRGNRAPGEKIVTALNLEVITMYREKRSV
jgi:DNA-binding transcriptional regulator YdaS (Cro superfamily)